MDSPKIRALADAYHAAKAAAATAREALNAAVIAASPYQLNDIIRSSKGNEAKVVSVFAVEGWNGEYDVRWTAVMRKRDGAWGIQKVPSWKDEWAAPTVIGREMCATPAKGE